MKLLIQMAALLVLASTATAAGPDLSQWTGVAPLEVASRPEKGLIEFPLPLDLLAKARPDLADLRLVNNSGENVPYVLRVDRGAPGRAVSYPARLYNSLFVPGRESSVTVDFGSKMQRTRIDVDTPGINFRRRIRVEASEDAATWQVLKASDWLFRISFEGGSFNKPDVSLPDNDFRYLRLTIFLAPDDPEQVQIRGVTAWNIQATPPQTLEVPTQSIQVTQDGGHKWTEIDADLGYENVPLYEVAAAFEDPNFLRRVELFGRNVKTRTIVEPVENSQPRKREVEEPWTHLTSGSFYRLPSGNGAEPSTGLALRVEASYRYIRLRIHNQDDAALKFSGLKVRRFQHFAAFRADAAGPFQVYFGNALAERPVYDLENYAERLRAEGVTAAALGPIGGNTRFAAATKVAPWSERHPAILWGGLIAVILVLVALIARQMKHLQAPGDAAPPAGGTGH